MSFLELLNGKPLEGRPVPPESPALALQVVIGKVGAEAGEALRAVLSGSSEDVDDEDFQDDPFAQGWNPGARDRRLLEVDRVDTANARSRRILKVKKTDQQ